MITRGLRRLGVVATLVVGAAALVAGCGAGTLSDKQLRTRATRICQTARRHTDRIKQPTAPTQGARFLHQGIVALTPQLRALRRLRPPDEMQESYRTALAAFDRELTTMRSTLKGLHNGNDPVVAIKTLQQELVPAEQRAAGAWRELEVPACASLTG